MKLFQSKQLWIMTSFVLFTGYWISCTKDDQVLDVPATTTVSGNELFSSLTATAPTIDGTVDAMWANAAKLSVSTVVPDPGNNMFTGYSGTAYTVTLRSMYDNQNIYFLAEVTDPDKNLKGSPWYFNPTTKLWAQEPNSKSFDVNGALAREGFGIDQLAMLWNIDNSTPKFASQTCYASCHMFTPYVDYSDPTKPVTKPNTSGNHYTNGQYEKIDMWWAHPARGLAYGNMDDEYQDWAGGPTYSNLVGGSANGRHFDDLVPTTTPNTSYPYAPTYTSDATQGSVNNRISLKPDGIGSAINVPMWVIPNSTSDYVKVEDTLAGGSARKITAVSSTGVLTYSGGTIDPNVGTDYQRTGNAVTGPTAAKSIPGSIISPVLRGRADIGLSAVYTGTGWVYEYKRLLKTTDALKQDVDFTSLQDQFFGVAYFNKSNYQHGIKTNLVLKFKK